MEGSVTSPRLPGWWATTNELLVYLGHQRLQVGSSLKRPTVGPFDGGGRPVDQGDGRRLDVGGTRCVQLGHLILRAQECREVQRLEPVAETQGRDPVHPAERRSVESHANEPARAA